MKQIGVRLEEELVKKAKQYALDTNISMQNLIAEALTSYLDNKLTIKQPETQTQQVNMLTSEQETIVDVTKGVSPALIGEQVSMLTNKQVNKITPVEIMEVEDEDDDDNTPAFASSSEDIPEWQKRELTPQDFYGKVPEPYTPGPYDHDPQRYLDEMLEEEKAKTEIKPKKPEMDDYVNPFL